MSFRFVCIKGQNKKVMNEYSKVRELKGIGEKTEKILEKIGIYTVGDLLRYYPRTYDIYEAPVVIADIQEGKTLTLQGKIFGTVQVSPNRKMQVTTAILQDRTGSIKIIWYRMPFLRNTLHSGMQIIVRGRIVRKREGLVMEHPELFSPAGKYEEKLHTMQPLYALTAGLGNQTVIKAVRSALCGIQLQKETLPEAIRRRYHLCEYNYAIHTIHFPKDKEAFMEARERLVFEEFLEFILAVRQMKEEKEQTENHCPVRKCPEADRFLKKLPFELTNAQRKVWEEIRQNMSGPYAMSRLVQGDVGSGKTIVAILALLETVYNGYQGAMMAPTEVLAKQHFESICNMFREYGIPFHVELLTGSMKVREKREACQRIESGEADIVIGTHALIQEKVNYRNLGLVITDEQHRFGVRQREALAKKGTMPHILVMSATPIPRTLAIILYGDMDLSVIDELPKNRLPIKNCVVDTGYRKTAYRFMKSQVEEGRQCYVICPMVEESETMEAENVMDYSAMLSEELGDTITVSYLHGKMKQAEKDEIMERFAKNEIQVLVSTTVIEVGINVPNATVMMVENAERFGLAQLHQLRGRVGRGKYQSYCIFMSASKTKETKKRLSILNHSNDGFYIASEDLKLRGPGDMFGIRQSGLLEFKLGDIFQDAKILQQAAEAAEMEEAKKIPVLSRVNHENIHIL